MPPDPARVAETRAWLHKASEEAAIGEAKLALLVAREVLEAILARPPGEVHP
jgi:hypothetical protein